MDTGKSRDARNSRDVRNRRDARDSETEPAGSPGTHHITSWTPTTSGTSATERMAAS